METPKYQHDCKSCKFLGHYFGCDVYYCPGDMLGGLGTVLARHSDDPPDYGSTPLKLLQDAIANPNHNIGGTDQIIVNGKMTDHRWTMPYRDYIFNGQVILSTKAQIAGVVAKCHELFR